MKRVPISIMTACLLAATCGVATNGIASGQDQPATKEGRIQTRKERQQKRIGQGVENGSLAAKEAANLEHKETKLNKEIRHDRKVNGGNLTDKEKKQINRQQNRVSDGIADKKHNDHEQK